MRFPVKATIAILALTGFFMSGWRPAEVQAAGPEMEVRFYEYISPDLPRRQVLTDTIDPRKIDLVYFREHFHISPLLSLMPPLRPDNFFVDTAHKNSTVDGRRYDAAGRITAKYYGSCFNCGPQAHDYRFYYDDQSRIEKIVNEISGKPSDAVQLFYDTKGRLYKLEVSTGGNWYQVIELEYSEL